MIDLRDRESNTETIDRFEDFLSYSLGEVDPDPQFVGHLRSQLTKKHEVELEHPRWLAAYAVIGVGLFSGVLLFWLVSQVFKGVRALILR